MHRMAPDDAQAYWLSRKTPTDQLLLYAFDPDVESVLGEVNRRARRIPGLTVRVRETVASLDYPYWVAASVRSDQIAVRDGAELSWARCLADVATLTSAPVDPCGAAWRVHVYPRVVDPPDGAGPASVAVLQISHALADGRGAATLARALFGAEPLAPLGSRRDVGPIAAALTGVARLPKQLGAIVVRGRTAYRLAAHAAPASVPFRPGALNVVGGPRQLRSLVLDADALRIGSCSVTVGAIVVIATALEDCPAVELTVARPASGLAHNNFHTVGIDTHPEIAEPVARARAVAAEIAGARARDDAPAAVAARHAAAATPAVLMRWGAAAFDPTARSSTVTGHTVVSSVNRGPADLVLGAGRVRFTAGFPALSSMQGVTHGVHGLGSTVTISVATTAAALPDVDAYVAALRRAAQRQSS